MRILYGVHGYGRGHATRALAILPHLAARHQVHVLAGGDAWQTIAPDHPVTRIPTLGFAYSQRGGIRCRSNWHTFVRNLPALLDLLCSGPTFQLVRSLVEEFSPDAIISDAETWSHQVARELGIPRIGIDHIGIMTHCRPELARWDRWTTIFDKTCYRLLTGRPDRVIVSSFFDAPPRNPRVRVVAALARAEVRQMQPRAGGHLVVYLNRGREQLHEGMVRELGRVGVPVHVYGARERGRIGALCFLPLSNLPFLEDLASCRAVISTAGNQLVGEALALGKPVLVFPERCAEQRMNALAVERMGIGRQATWNQFTAETIRQFLEESPAYLAQIRRHDRDGLSETLAAIESALAELVPAAAGRPVDAGAATAGLPV